MPPGSAKRVHHRRIDDVQLRLHLSPRIEPLLNLGQDLLSLGRSAVAGGEHRQHRGAQLSLVFEWDSLRDPARQTGYAPIEIRPPAGRSASRRWRHNAACSGRPACPGPGGRAAQHRTSSGIPNRQHRQGLFRGVDERHTLLTLVQSGALRAPSCAWIAQAPRRRWGAGLRERHHHRVGQRGLSIGELRTPAARGGSSREGDPCDTCSAPPRGAALRSTSPRPSRRRVHRRPRCLGSL